jgi:nucleoside-diphosphate-sugar epimerase
MKVLVTGGGGFLGFEICKLLAKTGHEVLSFSRTHHEKLDLLNIKTHCGSLINSNDIKGALHGVEAIIHTAAIAGVWGKYQDYYQTNFVGTKNLVGEAKKVGIKYFIYTSTPSVVFGKNSICGADENTPHAKKFLTSYAKTKSLAEKYVSSNASDDFLNVSIRPHLIWGSGDPHILPRLIERAKSGKLRIIGNGDNLVDVIHVTNAAMAHINALESLIHGKKINGKAYFVGQDKPVNLWNFINQMLETQGLSPVTKKISSVVAYRLGAIFESTFKLLSVKAEPPLTRFVVLQMSESHYFSHENAKNDLGYKPSVSIVDGLKDL